MYLENIKLSNFRNYHQLEFYPCQGLNILTGANAQGKTNLLEAIYYLATARALRTRNDIELVKAESTTMCVQASVQRLNSIPVDIQISYAVESLISGRHKQALIDTKPVDLVDVLGKLNVVVFSSLDLDIVRGEPSGRRLYLDTSIGMISSRYAHNVQRYRKVLEQRNRILKISKEQGGNMSADHNDSFEILTQQLVSYGAEIVHSRVHFINQLLPYAQEAHRMLSCGAEQLSISYVCPYEPNTKLGDIKLSYAAELKNVYTDELRRGTTCAGPHRDDLLISVNGMDVRHFGSQGQQRTATLALKMAEYQLVTKLKNEAPVLLLDDVFSDLDETRRARLLQMNLEGSQCILTCTEVDSLPTELLNKSKVYYVQAGTLR